MCTSKNMCACVSVCALSVPCECIYKCTYLGFDYGLDIYFCSFALHPGSTYFVRTYYLGDR